MVNKSSVGKKLRKINLVLIQGAVSSENTLNFLQDRFNLQVITLKMFELHREMVFRDNQIVWIHIETRIEKQDIDFLNKESVIVTTSTGSTHIANEVITFLGDRFVSLKTEPEFLKSITSTAELALTFILMGLTGMESAISSVKEGKWNRSENLRKKQVTSTQVGIIGYGRLGSILGTFLRPLVKEIIVWDKDENALIRAKKEGFRVAEGLSHLLSNSDAASIHVDASRGDKHLITRDSLVHARRGLVLVNTSRGLLVSEDSILWGIGNGLLSAYLTDVLECEDYGDSVTASKLWNAALSNSKITLTPHIGGASKDAMEKCEMNIAYRLDAMTQTRLI